MADKIKASELYLKLLKDNNLEVQITNLKDNIKTISDGSLIISPPTIVVSYKNDRQPAPTTAK